MSHDPAGEERDLEREIRNAREFSLAEAIGRLAGPGGMKGASPVNRLQQAQAAVDHLVRGHLRDPSGVLQTVLSREVGSGSVLLEGLNDPAAALVRHVQQILASPPLLAELVRMTDMEWGQVMGERPFFEVEGRPTHPEDPYTLVSVRSSLEAFVVALPTA